MKRVIHPYAFEVAEAVATAMRELRVGVSPVLGGPGATLQTGTHRRARHRRGRLFFSSSPAICSRAPWYAPHTLSCGACGALMNRQACFFMSSAGHPAPARPGSFAPPARNPYSLPCDKELKR